MIGKIGQPTTIHQKLKKELFIACPNAVVNL